MAEQRKKEMGIRKTMGASVSVITKMMLTDFMKWVLIANIIAWPIAFFAVTEWLQSFAYRIEMNYWLFLLGGFIALLIALGTVSFQSVKAAHANPVDSLRNE